MATASGQHHVLDSPGTLLRDIPDGLRQLSRALRREDGTYTGGRCGGDSVLRWQMTSLITPDGPSFLGLTRSAGWRSLMHTPGYSSTHADAGQGTGGTAPAGNPPYRAGNPAALYSQGG
ncbi:hypothetical protein WDV93_25015 [Pantoea ananatis]